MNHQTDYEESIARSARRESHLRDAGYILTASAISTAFVLIIDLLAQLFI